LTPADKTVDPLRELLAGEVLGPGAPGYENAWRLYIGMIDRHPAVIARFRGTTDVQAIVRFGREHNLELVGGSGRRVAGSRQTSPWPVGRRGRHAPR